LPGWLGVAVNDAADDTGPAASLATVLPKSPAARAGLRAGDLVLTVGGRRIRAARDLTASVQAHRPGTILTLAVRRGKVDLVVEAILEARPLDAHRAFEGERDAWQEPERVLDLLALEPGAAVADLGAGSGYFTERLAARVGSTGRVVAVEIDPDALRDLTRRFPESAFPQVVIERGSERDPGLAPGSLDLVLMVDTYHELRDAAAILAAVGRALRPGGRLAVIDRPAATDQPGAHAIPEVRVVEDAAAASFELRERHDLPRQFVLLFTKRTGNSP
jgi:predicted methyltransferase